MALGIAGFADAARSAPFCAIAGPPAQQCVYFDAAECRRAAPGGSAGCVGNPIETWLTQGTQRYCVVRADRAAQCLYINRESCERAAGPTAACLDSAERSNATSTAR